MLFSNAKFTCYRINDKAIPDSYASIGLLRGPKWQVATGTYDLRLTILIIKSESKTDTKVSVFGLTDGLGINSQP